jgi:hypothetical protein
MLKIRNAQLSLLEADRVRSATELVTRRLTWLYPDACVELGEAELQRLVVHGLATGRSCGIAEIDPLTRLAGLMLQFGLEFERSQDAERARALLLHSGLPGYIKVVELNELLDRNTRGRVLVHAIDSENN